jgi:hypothetical protein
MAKTANPKAWVALTIVVVLMLTFSSAAAFAAQPDTVPNSSASHNCVATSSGVLFSRNNNGEHLGQTVGEVAPHGGQREFVQGALQNTC